MRSRRAAAFKPATEEQTTVNFDAEQKCWCYYSSLSPVSRIWWSSSAVNTPPDRDLGALERLERHRNVGSRAEAGGFNCQPGRAWQWLNWPPLSRAGPHPAHVPPRFAGRRRPSPLADTRLETPLSLAICKAIDIAGGLCGGVVGPAGERLWGVER